MNGNQTENEIVTENGENVIQLHDSAKHVNTID